MNTRSYYGICLVLIVILFVILDGSYLIEKWSQKHDDSENYTNLLEFCRVFRNLLTGFIIFATNYVIQFLNQLFHHKNNAFATIEKSSFESFYFPILELVSVIIALWMRKREDSKYAIRNQLDICLITIGYLLPSLDIYYYNPTHYYEIYKVFVKYFRLWEAERITKNQQNVDEAYDAQTIWNEFKKIQAVESSDLFSKDEENKPYDQLQMPYFVKQDQIDVNSHLAEGSVSINYHLPNEFKVSEDCKERIIHIKPSSQILKDSCTAKLNRSNVLDKLYSVSPKNSFHLNTAIAMAFNAIEEEEANRVETESSPKFTSSQNIDDFLPDIAEVYENIDEESNHLNKNSNIACLQNKNNANYTHPNNTESSIFESNEHSSKLQIIIKFINWWSWLCTPLLPVGDHATKPRLSHTGNNALVNERFPLLKTKLSYYSLNEVPTFSDTGYHKSSQSDSKSIKISYDFQTYVSYYYDLTFNSMMSSIPVDNWFLKYGQILIKTNWYWILIDQINYISKQFFEFEIIGLLILHQHYIFLIINSTIILVLKLFCLNYLHSYSKGLDYRIIMISELFINLILLVNLILLSIFFNK